jgi:hypothetical protein
MSAMISKITYTPHKDAPSAVPLGFVRAHVSLENGRFYDAFIRKNEDGSWTPGKISAYGLSMQIAEATPASSRKNAVVSTLDLSIPFIEQMFDDEVQENDQTNPGPGP